MSTMQPFNYSADGLEVQVIDCGGTVQFDITWEGCGMRFELPFLHAQALAKWMYERHSASASTTTQRK